MITRENYEEYFLLYIDNELPVEARSAVEKFVAGNPQLKEEWEALLQCRIHPDQHEVFGDKEVLLQQDLLSYIDGELDEEGREAVQEFIGRYPSKAVELQQLAMTVSQPDLSVRFPGKESLYRTEKNRKLWLMPWMQAGIAAAVLGLVALLLLTTPHKDVPSIVKLDTNKKEPAAVTPKTPPALYSSGNDDQHREKEIAKSNAMPRKEKKTKETPGPAEKEADGTTKPDGAARPQEVAQTRVNITTTDSRPSETVIHITDTHPDAGEKIITNPAATVAAVNIPKDQSSFATQALLEEAQADGSKDLIAAAPAGRNKLRGIFRRVSRAFGKTADRDSDGQKEVLISAFQVALK